MFEHEKGEVDCGLNVWLIFWCIVDDWFKDLALWEILCFKLYIF